MVLPIKAIYSSDGKSVTGLAEVTGTGTDKLDISTLPTGTGVNEVALGNHTHTGTASVTSTATGSPSGQLTVFGSNANTISNLTTTFSLVKLNQGKIADASEDFSKADHNHDAAYVAKPSTGTTGLVKISSGVLTAAAAGTDYVHKDNLTTFTKPQVPSATSASGASVAWDLSSHQILRLTLSGTGSATLTLSGLSANLQGVSYRLIIKQTGTASLNFTGTSIKFQGGTPAISNTANKVDMYTFEVYSPDGASYYLYEIGRSLGLAV